MIYFIHHCVFSLQQMHYFLFTYSSRLFSRIMPILSPLHPSQTSMFGKYVGGKAFSFWVLFILWGLQTSVFLCFICYSNLFPVCWEKDSERIVLVVIINFWKIQPTIQQKPWINKGNHPWTVEKPNIFIEGWRFETINHEIC